MKLLKHNFKDGFVQLQVENLDDLWYISQIIDAGDLISGKTERKLKIGKGENVKIDRKVVFLKIEVEKVEFSKHSVVLRVSGKIVDGPEDVARGQYHTFNLLPEERTIVSLNKQEWLNYQIQKIKEAAKNKTSDIMIACFDREEVMFALVKQYGFEVISSYEGDVQKKDNDEKVKKDFYSEIIKNMEEYQKRYNLKTIIAASPAFFKDDLVKKINNAELKKIVKVATCSGTGKNAINEVLKRDEMKSILVNDRVAQEMSVVEDILKEISTTGKACYGMKDVEEKVNMGAVSLLAVTDSAIMKLRQEGSFSSLEKLMKLVEQTKGEIVIVSHEHDGGRKLNGLGGVAGLLRYKVEY